ncbi:MAG: Ig-like domain-containing protein, partial [Chloroflexota bacterium]
MTKARMMRILSAVVVFALLLGNAVAVPVTAAGEVPVTINAPANALPGSNFTATIDIGSVTNFDAANYDVSFNPAVLRLDDITDGSIGGTVIPVEAWNEWSPGTFTAVQNVPGLTGASGSGYLAVLHFFVIGSAGQTSNITLSNGMLGNNLAQQIPATWVGDSVVVGALKTLASIAVTPTAPTVIVGQTRQFNATGTYSDNSTANLTATAIWTTNNTSVATINSAGLATAIAAGTAFITAASGNITSPGVTLTVIAPALVSIAVTPVNPSIALGLTKQFSATGTYNDASTANLTATAIWTSSNTAVATINSAGLATALAPGTTTIRATSGAVSGNTTLGVGASLVLLPASQTVNVNNSFNVAIQVQTNGEAVDGVSAYLDFDPTKLAVNSVTPATTWAGKPVIILENTFDSVTGQVNFGSGLIGQSAMGTFTVATVNFLAKAAASNTNITFHFAPPLQRHTDVFSAGSSVLNTATGAIVTILDPVSIAVAPVNPSIALGLTRQFTATGTFADNSTAILTAAANWTSSNPGVATINSAGLATALAVGTTTIRATFGSISGNTTLTVTAADLVSITVTPTASTITAGLTQQFTATGTYTNGTTANITGSVTWISSNPGVATISNAGLATSLAQGTTTITATSGAIVSTTATLTVTAPVLLSIAVIPSFASIPLGLTQQYTAIGTYTNGPSNITVSVTWGSSNSVVATINPVGLATSVGQGTTIITASLSGKTSPDATLLVTAPRLLSLTVSPSTATITAGQTRQFTATGNFTDNPSRTITNVAAWTSSDSSIASIQTAGEASPGLAKGHKPGTVSVTATLGGKSATAIHTVTAATISSIAVTPVNPTITLGSARQFRAIAIKSDGSLVDVTTTATWTSGNTGVATIGANTGLATSVAAGVTTITATFGGISGDTPLTVTAATLQSIAVTPAGPAVAAGRTQQFTATGTYSDAITVDLTNSVIWSSSNNVTARIRAGGLANSYAAGTTVITATSGSISGNTTLAVTAAVLDSIRVTPLSPTITFISGAPPTLQFTATAVYSDGSTTDNTTTAAWTSSAPAVATVNAASGLATTVAAGASTITATLGGKTGTTLLTVLADRVAPVVTLSSPADGLVTSSLVLTVSGRADDVNASTSLILNGGAPIVLTLDGAGSFSANVNLTVGSNTILVRAVDGAGNIGTSGTRTVRVDPRQPNIIITSPVEGFVTNNPVVTVTGTVFNAAAGSLTVRVNGVIVATGLSTGNFSIPNVILSSGRNNIIASGYGTGGNGNAAFHGTSGARTAILDTTAPVVAITSPSSGSIVNTPGIRVNGTVDDPAVSTATLTINGVSQSVPVRGGRFSQDIQLAAGSNTITVRATDGAGNTSLIASVTVTFDNTKPEITVTAPTNRQLTNVGGQLVTGNVSDPSIITATLLVNNVSQTISVAPDGSFGQGVSLTPGLNTIEVRATDAASNTGTSGIINVTLDTTPPVVSIGLSDPTDSIIITVTSNEALAAIPNVNVNATGVTMTQIAATRWTGIYAVPASGTYTVTATGTDLAGNPTTTTAVFLKQALSVVAGNATSIQAGTTSLQITTNTTATNQSISVTQHTENPAENTASGTGAGIFVEIVASGNLTGSIQSVEIRVAYDEADIIARGIAEATLKLYLWSSLSGQWEVVPGSSVNTVQNYIFGIASHLSTYGGFGTPAELVSIAVIPPAATIIQGLTQQFTATGTYSDNSTANLTANWTSSNTGVATINSDGLATALAAGTTTISATSGNVTSPGVTLTVTPAVLASIAVTPSSPSVARTLKQQFNATGTYNNNLTANLTAAVAWTSSNTGVATINAAGLASSLAAGTTTITATLGTISGFTTLTVTQSTTVEVNSGNTITLNTGASINATTSSGIAVAVKGLPNLGAPVNGLAGFRFDFSWNKNVINVNSAFKNNAAG